MYNPPIQSNSIHIAISWNFLFGSKVKKPCDMTQLNHGHRAHAQLRKKKKSSSSPVDRETKTYLAARRPLHRVLFRRRRRHGALDTDENISSPLLRLHRL